MTEQEKITFVQAFFDAPTPTSGECTVALTVAKHRVMQQRYGLVGFSEAAPFPTQYELEQCELAVRYISRKGGYGEVAHKENGVDRSWASEDDLDILKRIPPLAKVVGGTADADAES